MKTSDDVLELQKPPKRMVIVGAGVVAFEFGQVFARVGTTFKREASSPGILQPYEAKSLDRKGLAQQAHAPLRSLLEKRIGTGIYWYPVLVIDLGGWDASKERNASGGQFGFRAR